MITKVIKVGKYMDFRQALQNIKESSEGFLISDMYIENYYVSYDLLGEGNESSISILMDKNIVNEIIITMEKADINLINKFKEVWND